MTIERQIIGPPGCGKTTRARDYVRQITDPNYHNRVEPKNIALVSFTNAAAQVLASAGIPVPRSNIGTLHSAAFRAGKFNSEKIAELCLDDWNKEQANFSLSQAQNKGMPDQDTAPDMLVNDTPGDDLLNRYNIFRARLIPVQAWPAPVALFAKKWESWKEANDLIDFTDMISMALENIDVWPGNPQVIICDEAQDFTPLELALLKKWSAHADIINWILDPDQILYEFKGVDPRSFLANQDRPGLVKQVLDQSYRVPVAPHALAVRWINRVSERIDAVYKPTSAPGAVIYNRLASYQRPESLLEQIEQAVGAGRSVMIMGACSYMLDPIIQVLRKEGIPFHNPNRKTRGDWNPLDGGGRTASMRLLDFLRPSAEIWQDESRFWTNGDLQNWAEILQSQGVLKRGAKAAIERLTPEDTSELIDYVGYFEESALERAIELDLTWFKQSLLPKKSKSFEFPLKVLERFGAAKLKEPRQVKVGTIHSFKGDEADLCILFPDLSMRGMAEWEKPGPSRNRVIRQFYVAITRTKNELVICDPASNLGVSIK